jgi:signal transduction histidine kinase
MSNDRKNLYSSIEYLSQLTGGLAHEIRNPLSTLKVNLQLLAEDVRELGDSEDDRIRRSVLRIARMQDEVNRLRDILDDFIQFVGHHQLNLQRSDLNEQIDQLIDFYEPQAQANQVRLLKQFASEPLMCSIDRDLVKQAMLNLFINAQQAMPEGGDLMVRTARNDHYARVEVIDTGVGMDAEIRSKIFDAYFSSKKGGTGLGLAMTRRIVEEHHGLIEVHSEPGKGTRFVVSLPLAMEEAAASENEKI